MSSLACLLPLQEAGDRNIAVEVIHMDETAQAMGSASARSQPRGRPAQGRGALGSQPAFMCSQGTGDVGMTQGATEREERMLVGEASCP